jgi:alpha-mannosidase
MERKKIHLICNSHLDPVWLWEWEEGAAEAISTFRVAADFCEEYEGFIFNHNEAILYRWVEEFEPQLFARIQKLVKEGKWHIMGGWYLQPDCNMPSGEALVRQALVGRRYFKEKFDAEPTTAVNFDPFGHSRGLVQILKRSGYDSYIFCRPGGNELKLPANDFIWVGYDGSEINAYRAYDHYLTLKGQAADKVKKWMGTNRGKTTGLVLWGIGDHGGGPSRIDLEDLRKIADEEKEYEILHSVPEGYFSEIRENISILPRYGKGLKPSMTGCYTSQIRIKQTYRKLENELFMLEKTASQAAVNGLMTYPSESIKDAIYDLLTSQFHDILPGSSIQPVEEAALRQMEHGREIVSRLKAKAFFALAKGQPKAKDGEIPILVFNPHPYRIQDIFECEFQLPDQNWGDGYSMPVLYQNNKKVPCQTEKEKSNLNLDWRKHLVFRTALEPSSMNRFDCRIEMVPKKPELPSMNVDKDFKFSNEDMTATINHKTGLIDSYIVGETEYLRPDAFLLAVLKDNADPWQQNSARYADAEGKFRLMTHEESASYSGIQGKRLDPVRIIEDGEVSTVVEAVFCFNDSFACRRYRIPKKGTEIEIRTRVNWNEKDKMLKLSIPSAVKDPIYLGQTVFGTEELSADGYEMVSQKWVALMSFDKKVMFSCINDGIYGSDLRNGQVRLSLLRSPAYSCLPINDRSLLPEDRFTPRIDQGEREYTIWINAGPADKRMEKIDREAMTKNEKPFVLSFFPEGTCNKQGSGVMLDDETIVMTAFKMSEDGKGYIVRLFEPTGCIRKTTLVIPAAGIKKELSFTGFEVKTLRIDAGSGDIHETDMNEKDL